MGQDNCSVQVLSCVMESWKLEVGSRLLVKFLECYPKMQVKSNKQFSVLAWKCDLR